MTRSVPSPTRARPTRRCLGLVLCIVLAACQHGEPRTSAATRAAPGSPAAVATAPRQDVASTTTNGAAPDLPHVTLAAGSEDGTDALMARDLSSFVGPDAGIAIDVRTTRGSADNMHLLHDDRSVDLAIVQYDVVQALLDQSAKGDAAATGLVKSLRIVAPLYTQEIYFVVRSDSPLQSVDEIRGRRINVGAPGSGSALTIAALYQQMFGTPLRAADARYLADDKALVALTVDRAVDVVAIVAGQPARLFADMRPEARKFIRLLPVDDRRPASRAAYRGYFPATIRADGAAAWLDADVPAFSVMSFLVTTDGRRGLPDPVLARFAKSLCHNLDALRRDGHPKWREVNPGLQIGVRFTYASASAAEFARCPRRTPMSATQ